MSQTIPNLWSEKDIKVEVLSPLAILHTQATNLEQMTKGLIETEITVVTSDKGETVYQLDLIAPALGGYRHRLFAISHHKDMVYPVKFVLPEGQAMPLYARLDGVGEIAETEAAFLEKLGEVLKSNHSLREATKSNPLAARLLLRQLRNAAPHIVRTVFS
jgi:hypothetical protein